ncbi:hypothetical protein IW262DRAFT_1497125 [Armillaria fumosa]|nr:hypothetical protein IW262DRAFT_1497125 [Armillaria fumosa]
MPANQDFPSLSGLVTTSTDAHIRRYTVSLLIVVRFRAAMRSDRELEAFEEEWEGRSKTVSDNCEVTAIFHGSSTPAASQHFFPHVQGHRSPWESTPEFIYHRRTMPIRPFASVFLSSLVPHDDAGQKQEETQTGLPDSNVPLGLIENSTLPIYQGAKKWKKRRATT